MMWGVLFLASCCELGFTVFMKLSDGFRRRGYAALTVLAVSLSIYLLSTAAKTLPLGLSYAVWTGLGTLFNVVFGILVFGESRDRAKLLFMGMVMLGVIGLRCSA